MAGIDLIKLGQEVAGVCLVVPAVYSDCHELGMAELLVFYGDVHVDYFV